MSGLLGNVSLCYCAFMEILAGLGTVWSVYTIRTEPFGLDLGSTVQDFPKCSHLNRKQYV